MTENMRFYTQIYCTFAFRLYTNFDPSFFLMVLYEKWPTTYEQKTNFSLSFVWWMKMLFDFSPILLMIWTLWIGRGQNWIDRFFGGNKKNKEKSEKFKWIKVTEPIWLLPLWLFFPKETSFLLVLFLRFFFYLLIY